MKASWQLAIEENDGSGPIGHGPSMTQIRVHELGQRPSGNCHGEGVSRSAEWQSDERPERRIIDDDTWRVVLRESIATMRQHVARMLAARTDNSNAGVARLAALQRETGHLLDAGRSSPSRPFQRAPSRFAGR